MYTNMTAYGQKVHIQSCFFLAGFMLVQEADKIVWRDLNCAGSLGARAAIKVSPPARCAGLAGILVVLLFYKKRRVCIFNDGYTFSAHRNPFVNGMLDFSGG